MRLAEFPWPTILAEAAENALLDEDSVSLVDAESVAPKHEWCCALRALDSDGIGLYTEGSHVLDDFCR